MDAILIIAILIVVAMVAYVIWFLSYIKTGNYKVDQRLEDVSKGRIYVR